MRANKTPIQRTCKLWGDLMQIHCTARGKVEWPLSQPRARAAFRRPGAEYFIAASRPGGALRPAKNFLLRFAPPPLATHASATTRTVPLERARRIPALRVSGHHGPGCQVQSPGSVHALVGRRHLQGTCKVSPAIGRRLMPTQRQDTRRREVASRDR